MFSTPSTEWIVVNGVSLFYNLDVKRMEGEERGEGVLRFVMFLKAGQHPPGPLERGNWPDKCRFVLTFIQHPLQRANKPGSFGPGFSYYELRYMVTTAAPPRPILCWSPTLAPST
jgi:hypothetical protein